MRGASPSCVVKISKVHARQTSVEYSITLVGGKALRSSGFFLAVMIKKKEYVQPGRLPDSGRWSER